MKSYIYADNAATTKLDADVFEIMKPYMLGEFGNPSQPYSFSRRPKAALKEARNIIAECIHALPEEIFFTSGGTESDNWAIKGSAAYWGERKEIITSSIEHHAVLNSCKALERKGYKALYLASTNTGLILPEELEKNISDNTGMVSVMYGNNEIGTLQPVRKLAEISHNSGALFHTDAVQAAGHVKIDVKRDSIDLLSASAHKFNGPKGVGFLYIRKGTPIYPYEDGGGQERGMRAGTENVPGILGMAAALKKNCEQMEENAEHLLKMEKLLLSSLSELDYVRNGDEHHLPGLLSLSFKGADGEILLHRLDLKGICVSTGSACDGKNAKISHVLRAIHAEKEYAEGTIRISLGKSNTVEEVLQIGKTIKEILMDR